MGSTPIGRLKDILLPFQLKYLFIYSLKLKDYLLTFDTIYGLVRTTWVQPRASGVDSGGEAKELQVKMPALVKGYIFIWRYNTLLFLLKVW